MPAEQDKNKVRDFINHLLQNPNIRSEPILIGEGLILNFIVQNMNQLKTTFTTPQFFPHLGWNEVLQIIVADLYGRTCTEALPLFREFIDTADLDALNRVEDAPNLPADFQRQKFHSFLDEIFKNKDVRYNFNSVYNIFKYGIIEKYLSKVFERHDFLYNELVRVQKTYLECEDYIVFLKALLIVRNAACLKIPLNPGNESSRVSLTEALKMPGKVPKFIDEVVMYLRRFLPNLTEKTVRLAVKSNLKEKMTEKEDASSRLVLSLLHGITTTGP